MRLLFITHTLPPAGREDTNIGGMQRGAVELTRTLRAHPRVDLEAVTLRTSTRWEVPRTTGFLANLLATLPARVRKHRSEAVFFSSPVTASLLPVLKPSLGGVPTASIVHGLDATLPFPPFQWWVPRVFSRLDALFPISRATAEECLVRGASPEKTHVIPFGVDPARFADAPDAESARQSLVQRLALSDDAFVLVSLGRQVRRKGSAWFVEHVMPRLPERVHYVILGDGPETPAILEAAAPVAGRVHLLGRVSDLEMKTALRGADLFVMPNVPVPGDMEGQGLVMLEAGLLGRPSVASDMEGIADVVAEGESGHLVEPLNAGAFVSAIRQYVDAPEPLAALSERTVRYVEAEFSWPAIADRYVRQLEALVANRKA